MSDLLIVVLGLATILLVCGGIDYVDSHIQKIMCDCGNISSEYSYMRTGDIDSAGLQMYTCPNCGKRF